MYCSYFVCNLFLNGRTGVLQVRGSILAADQLPPFLPLFPLSLPLFVDPFWVFVYWFFHLGALCALLMVLVFRPSIGLQSTVHTTPSAMCTVQCSVVYTRSNTRV